MYLQFVSSSIFLCITAWAVVAEPEKKSSIISSFLVAIFNISIMYGIGLGVSNTILENNFFISSAAFAAFEVLSQSVSGILPSFSKIKSFRYKKFNFSAIDFCLRILFYCFFYHTWLLCVERHYTNLIISYFFKKT